MTFIFNPLGVYSRYIRGLKGCSGWLDIMVEIPANAIATEACTSLPWIALPWTYEGQSGFRHLEEPLSFLPSPFCGRITWPKQKMQVWEVLNSLVIATVPYRPCFSINQRPPRLLKPFMVLPTPVPWLPIQCIGKTSPSPDCFFTKALSLAATRSLIFRPKSSAVLISFTLLLDQ